MNSLKVETPKIVKQKSIVNPKNELVAKLDALNENEVALKEVAEHCLSLQILGQEDKEGYKVARAELTKLVSTRTGIDKAAEPYFDLVKSWKLKGENTVSNLKGLIAKAESHLGAIVKEWKAADDLRIAKAKEAKEKLIKERTLKLEAAGAILKGGFFILDEISISLDAIKKQKEDRFAIIVEEFEEKNNELILLAEQRIAEIEAIDPMAKANLALLKGQTDEQFEEYKELISLRAEKNKATSITKPDTPVTDMNVGEKAPVEIKGNEGEIEDAKEISTDLPEPSELLGLWWAEINKTCHQDLNGYKSPEREILKKCKKGIIAVFSKALAEMKNIDNL